MRSLLVVLCLLLLPGCATITSWRDAAALKAGYTSKARAEQAIEQVRSDYAAKQAANDKLVAAAQEAFTKGLNDRLQFVADQLYGADLAFLLTPHPDRTHLIMDNKINEARAVAGSPSVAAMTAQNAEIKRLLDETQTSLAQLQAAHAAALTEAAQVKERAVKAETDLAAAKEAQRTLETAEAKAISEKQAALAKVNDQVIAAEHARSDDEVARHKTLEKMSLWLGLFSLVGIAAAVYLPVYRIQTAALGAILGLAAVGIWYITPLVVGISVLTVFVALGIWMARNHLVATKTTTALVNAVQDIKDKAPEVYAATVKPALTEWTTKYTKAPDGTTISVPDKAVNSAISTALVANNRV